MSDHAPEEPTESGQPIATDDADPPAAVSESAQLRLVDLLALGTAAVLCVGFLSVSMIPAWSPRIAILLVAVPPGIVLLASMVRRRDPPALLLAVALGWAAVTSLAQAAPLIRLLGMLGASTSVFIYCGAAACWSLGRATSERGRAGLPAVLIGALGLSAAVAFAQVGLQVHSGPFALAGNRAHGLTSYAVYFGVQMTVACVLVASRECSGWKRSAQGCGVLLFAIAGSMSGTRIALLTAIAALGYLAYRRRSWWSVAHAGLVLVGAVVGAALVSTRLGPAADESDGGTSIERFGFGGDGAGGIGWRIDGWRAGLDAWVERPVIGWGLGNFRQAVQTRLHEFSTVRTARFDAHNVIVEWLVGVGIVGCLLFVAFCVFCAREARGPLALAVCTLATTWLLQPAGLPTLPLGLLMLGAAMPSVALIEQTNYAAARRALGVATVLGVAAAGAFAVTDLRLNKATDKVDSAALVAVGKWYPWDPNVADFTAQALMFDWRDAGRDPRDEAPALDWSRRAIQRQPDAPRWLDSMAARQIAFGRFDEARFTLDRALELQPDRFDTWRHLAYIANELGDEELLARSERTLCNLQPTYC